MFPSLSSCLRHYHCVSFHVSIPHRFPLSVTYQPPFHPPSVPSLSFRVTLWLNICLSVGNEPANVAKAALFHIHLCDYRRNHVHTGTSSAPTTPLPTPTSTHHHPQKSNRAQNERRIWIHFLSLSALHQSISSPPFSPAVTDTLPFFLLLPLFHSLLISISLILLSSPPTVCAAVLSGAERQETERPFMKRYQSLIESSQTTKEKRGGWREWAAGGR